MRFGETYGLYTPDLKANALKEVDLETAKRFRHGELVVCSERIKYYGFSFTVMCFWREWHFMFRRWGWYIGPFKFSFERLAAKVADKIVWRGEDDEKA